TVYVAGDFEGTANFGAAGDLVSAGKSDAVLVRVAPDGAIAAAWPLGGVNQERGDAVAVDGGGHVAFGGLFSDKVTFGGLAATATGSDDAFVGEVDAKGHVEWLWTTGGRDSDDTTAIAAVPSGGWLVAVSFADKMTVGGVELTSRGSDDVALVRLSADGDVRWVTQLGGAGYDVLNRLAVDPNGGIYAIGAFRDTTDLGGGELKSAGALDMVVARFDPGGKHLWSKRIGGAFNEKPGGIAVDPAGGIVITGSFDKDVDFLGTPLLAKGESDIFVARLDDNGALQWVKQFGAEREDAGFGVVVDAAGVASVTGWFDSIVDFGGGPMKSKGYHDVFVARFARDGAYRGAVRFGDQDYDEGRGIALAPDGSTVVTGLYRYTNDLGPTRPVAKQAPGTRFAKPDMFIVELAP
ncbi:MAG TPA: SBBP repeat-containing protein, partial [Kofleriaceae bacterium]|nr:SBBP repeat-containing protein [Kofleriaceae bacterium]